MIHTVKIVASTLAIGLTLVAYVPYLLDMFRGKNRPHLYTWISIFLVTCIVAYLQVIGGAGVGAIPMLLSIGVCAVFFSIVSGSARKMSCLWTKFVWS